MKKLLRRVRGALGMGLVWAIGGMGVGGLIELILNILPGPDGAVIDMWPQVLAIVGFIAGTIFGTVLGIAAGRRRFDELSLPGFAGWGALAGLLLGGLGVATGGPVLFVVVTTLASAIAGAVSLALARMAEDRGLLHAGAAGAEVGRAGGETPELLGRSD